MTTTYRGRHRSRGTHVPAATSETPMPDVETIDADEPELVPTPAGHDAREEATAERK